MDSSTLGRASQRRSCMPGSRNVTYAPQRSRRCGGSAAWARLSRMDWCGRLVALCGALLLPVASGQDIQTPDRFQLFNNCKPMGLEIGNVFDDVLALGIAEENVRAAAESRLRAAQLYTANAPASLFIAVSKYKIQLKYRKPVRDLASSEIRAVWTFSNAAEVRDGTAASVMLEIAKQLDRFLVEYLRVNESVCGQAAAPERAPSVGSSKDVEPAIVHRVDDGSVTSPRVIWKTEPNYTEKARRAKIQGVVLLDFEVWEDGRAHNIKVLRSLHSDLDEKAIEAVKTWTFKPGTKDGQPVRVGAQIQVAFRLL